MTHKQDGYTFSKRDIEEDICKSFDNNITFKLINQIKA